MRADDAYPGWDSEARYRRLPEVRAALSALGWEIRPVGPGGGVPDLARGRRPEVAWVLDHPPRVPRQGVGVLTVAADDAEQVLGAEVNLSYGVARVRRRWLQCAGAHVQHWPGRGAAGREPGDRAPLGGRR
ncbi:hypothetical protein ID875_11765 [Streptomyces globisporus]|uniref:Uncharacterized protein n=1 Tax=Streptomyces globisporus TaxID=1908 RepID=A0A927BLE5_STRGL|nr:hypothetical protein [Streptomyces globisporus]